MSDQEKMGKGSTAQRLGFGEAGIEETIVFSS